MSCAPAELYASALERGPLHLHGEDGSCRHVPLERWLGPTGPADAGVLDRALGPVLDVGCGPGRHVLALVRRGVVAVGVDVTPAAVRHARARGAAVLLGSVFAPVPGAGHWRTVLLLDGNIGIGACPAQLLRRVAALLAPEGEVLVELTPPGRGVTIQRLRLEHRHAFSAWFEWATVAVDAIGEPAAEAQLVVAESWCDGGRWFARLVRR